MSFSQTCFATVAILLIALEVQSFGEIVVVYHPYSRDSAKKLTCISEDDSGTALTWNDNPQDPPTTVKDFRPRRPPSGKVRTCAIRNASHCLAGWDSTTGWAVVNSKTKPTGPVFDHRWEDFQEYRFKGASSKQSFQYVGEVKKSPGTMWFSARGKYDNYVYLCNMKDLSTGPCIWIILSGWSDKRSALRSCAKGTANNNKPCDRIGRDYEHKPNEIVTTPYEWRTFKVEWNTEQKTIKVFKANETEPFLNGTRPTWHSESYVTVKPHETSVIRFHFYDYYSTETKNAVITTRGFNHSNKIFRADILVGLCPKCKLKVNLLDADERNIQTWMASGDVVDSHSGLLTWQSVKLDAVFDNDDCRYLKFVIETILVEDQGSGQWAIDNFRMYESGGQWRRSDITLPKGREDPVTCEKLSYTGVDTLVKHSVSPHGSDRAEGQLRKFLRRRKERDIGRNGWICNPNGCICGRGFTGEGCAESCRGGLHGHNCEEKCGLCFNSEACNAITGFCPEKCEGTNLPPLCQKDLEAPTVKDIGDTRVMVHQKIELDVDQDQAMDVKVRSVEVYIRQSQMHNEPARRTFFSNPKLSENASVFEVPISGLNRSSVYAVYTIAYVEVEDKSPIPIKSQEHSFATTCYGRSKFRIETSETSLTVRAWNESCKIEPHPDHFYSIIVIDTSKQKPVGDPTFFTSVPFRKTGLEPATNYTVRVRDTVISYELNFTNIWTSESAPSEVVDLTINPTNTTATLRWEPPSYKGGVIRNYIVSIKLTELKGCKDFDEKTPDEEMITQNLTTTMTTFGKLHPYAKYMATVTAYNSKQGSPVVQTFETHLNDIPTSVVRHLRINERTNCVEWDRPICTTITGPAKITRLIIKRENDTERNIDRRRDVQVQFYNLDEFHLDPFTKYTLRAHVMRAYGNRKVPDVYREHTWRTKPAAPSAVKNLTVYNADWDTKTLSLRWMPPNPANGEIEFYVVSIWDKTKKNYLMSTKNTNENIDFTFEGDFVYYKNLDLSPYTANYNGEIHVFAKNKDVEERGKTSIISINQDIFEKKPSKPENLTFNTDTTSGVVTLKWKRPWFSPTKIQKFYIDVQYVETDLLDDSFSTSKSRQMEVGVVDEKQKKYSTELNLFPSTTYNISIVAVNGRGCQSTPGTILHLRVPGRPDFASELQLNQESESSIAVQVPTIINATKNTWVTINVHGLRTCVGNHSRTRSSQNEPTSWDAKKYRVENNNGDKVFYLSGINDVTEVASNCSLHIGETYMIEVSVGSEPSSSKKISSKITLINGKPPKSYLGWLFIIPILGICLLLLFFRWRKRNKSPLLEPPITEVGTSTAPWNLKHTHQQTQHHVPDVIPFNPQSYPVEINEFEEYTKDGLKSGLLRSQYEDFPKGITKPCEYGKLPENTSKNRWANLIAYDDSRVVLKMLEDPHSDYINASYIPGYRNEKAYIATQGPKLETINDFWRMIWQEDVRVICMLANVIEHGRKKCEQYWPEIETKIKYGEILVSHVNQDVYIDYTVRTFKLSSNKKKREVTHLHYTGWPDHGVPMFTQSVIPYLKKLQAMATGDQPVVVHCSAGVGRTGTIILCDTCLRQAKSEGVVDLAAVTARMRKYRPRMVDNEQQYIFAHMAIVEYMLSEQTEIPCDEDSTVRINESRKRLIKDIKRVRDIIWGERVMHAIGEPESKLPDNLAENEIAEVVQVDSSMGLFEPSKTFVMNRNHIQTVSIDGFKIENQYLITWQPSPSTRSKLWEMIADDNIELVIVLQRPDGEDPTCSDLMPSDSNPVSSRRVQVEDKECFEEDEYFIINKLSVTKTSEKIKEPQSVTVLTCQGWGCDKESKPPAVGALVSLWMASEKVSRSESPTLVLCHDGVTGCGLYVALSFLLERIAVEKECDVISAVRKVRRFKPEFGQSIEQFEYLYDAAVNYVERFKTYSNFS